MATSASPPTDHPVAELNPSVGLATGLGIVGTLLGLIAGVIAAIDGNDVATAGAAAGSILSLVTTMGGRYAQASALAAGKLANLSPWIDEAQRLAAEHARAGTTYSTGGAPTPIDPTLPSS